MKDFMIVQVVPTGVKAAIGGYVGDATPATNLIASCSDYVITHPNVVNGVVLNLARENCIYTEGYMLDQFFLGNLALREVRSNRIGVVLDCEAEKESLNLSINTVEAIRANKGIDVVGYVITNKPIHGKAVKTAAGAFVGEIEDPNEFLKPAKKIIEKGAEAVAIGTVIEIRKKDLKAYLKGIGPNPYGGTEALISRTISRRLGVPSAHAPILSLKEMEHMMFKEGLMDPRAAAEGMCSAYLGSVLQGLHKAPHPIRIEEAKEEDVLLNDISAVVMPASCLGGIPALSAQKNGIPLIGVKENTTVLSVTADKLGLDAIIVENYVEAAGIVAAIKEGIDLSTLRRPLERKKIFR